MKQRNRQLMTRLLPFLLVSFAFLSALGQKMDNGLLSCARLNGEVFQYLYRQDIPKHLFTLVFNCNNDTLKGTIFGPDPEGEHGLLFFKSNLDSISLTGNSISFSFVQGDLFDKALTLESYNKPSKQESKGWSSYRLYYKGSLQNDTIAFICSSEFYNCYADTMNFIRK